MREEFDTPTTQDIRQWRLFLASQLRRSKDARRCFSGSENDWKRMIRSLENPGVYENPCGDLMLPALAHSLCVDVILFNTRRTSAPIYPVSSTVWGGSHPAEDAEDNQYQEFQEFHSDTNEFWIKNQTKWQIELWTLKREMETDKDHATMRESFSLVPLVPLRKPYILTTSGLTTGRQFWGRQSWVFQL